MTRPAVLVTGGARRIGAAIARRFGRAGWHVVIHCCRSYGEAQAACLVGAVVADAAGPGLLRPGIGQQRPTLIITHRFDADAGAAGELRDAHR